MEESEPIDGARFCGALCRLSLRSAGRLSCHRLLTFLPVVYGMNAFVPCGLSRIV